MVKGLYVMSSDLFDAVYTPATRTKIRPLLISTMK